MGFVENGLGDTAIEVEGPLSPSVITDVYCAQTQVYKMFSASELTNFSKFPKRQ